jgi:hypothetical protein
MGLDGKHQWGFAVLAVTRLSVDTAFEMTFFYHRAVLDDGLNPDAGVREAGNYEKEGEKENAAGGV